MEVTFVRELDFIGPDILLQQMVECQTGLNAEYNSEQNQIISFMKSVLQNYLNRTHPGLAVPENGPHFQFVINSFEEFAILLLESSDLKGMLKQLKEQRAVVRSQIADYKETKANDSSQTIQEKKAILERIRDSVGVMTQMRMDCNKHVEKVIFKFQKLLDLAEKTHGDDVSGEEEDVILAILRRGILSFYNPNLRKMISQRLLPWRQLWLRFKEQEESFLQFVDDNMKLLGPSESKLNAMKWIGRKWRNSMRIVIKGNQGNRKEDRAASTH